MKPKVSVIMPAYNTAKYIKQAIASLIGQSEKSWELIVVNDASTDQTETVVRTLMEHEPRIRLIVLPENKGSAVARNMALKQVKGRYLAFLDADDLWHPDKLKRQLSFMEETGASITFTAFDSIGENGELLRKAETLPDAVNYDMMLQRNWLGCLTVMLDTQKLRGVEFPLIAKRQDYALWLKLMRENQVPALCLNQSLASHRIRENALSKKKVRLLRYNYRVFRDHEAMSRWASFCAVSRNVWHYFFQQRQAPKGSVGHLKRTAVWLALFTLISKAMGFLREVLIAKAFGAGSEADSFFLMGSLVSFLWLFGGVFNNGMIPLLIEIRNRRGDEASLIRRLTQGVLIFYGLVVALLIVFAPAVVGGMGFGFTPEKQALTVSLFRIGVFSIFFGALFDLNLNYLKSHQIFLVGNFAGITSNLVYIGFFLLLPISMQSIQGLAVAMVFAGVAKYATTIPFVKRMGFQMHWEKRFWDDADVKKLFRLSVPLVLGGVVYRINGIVDKVLATPLQGGSVSALNYSYRIVSTYESVVLAVFVMLLFPTLSHFAQTERQRFRRAMDRAMRVMVDVLVPSAVGLVVLAEPVVAVIYRRGAFDMAALAQTAGLLRIYSIGVIAIGANALYVKGFYANQETKKPMVIGVISVSVNIVLDFILVGPFGVQGLAVATVIASYLGLAMKQWVFYRDYGKADLDSKLPAMVPPLCASAIMAVVVIAVQDLLGPHYLMHLNLFLKLGGLMTVIATGAVAYLVVLRLFHPPEWDWLLRRRD